MEKAKMKVLHSSLSLAVFPPDSLLPGSLRAGTDCNLDLSPTHRQAGETGAISALKCPDLSLGAQGIPQLCRG